MASVDVVLAVRADLTTPCRRREEVGVAYAGSTDISARDEGTLLGGE